MRLQRAPIAAITFLLARQRPRLLSTARYRSNLTHIADNQITIADSYQLANACRDGGAHGRRTQEGSSRSRPLRRRWRGRMVRRVRELGLSLTGRDGRVGRGVGLGARRTSFGVCRLAWED